MNIADEVKEDFKTAVEKIDFKNYNPNSPEFIQALRIGKMWRLLTKLDECCLEKEETVETYSKKPDEITENLNSAKYYIQKLIDTRDVTFRSMAMGELSKVEHSLKKAYSKLPNADEKAKLKNYEYEYSEISKQLNSL